MIAFFLSRTGIMSLAAAGFSLLALYAWGLQQANGRLELDGRAVARGLAEARRGRERER